MADDREPLGRTAHETYGNWLLEQVRLPHDAKHLNQWEQLSPDLREAYMRIGAAVAVQAVADAKLRNERLEMLAFTLGTCQARMFDAFRVAIHYEQYEARKEPYRKAVAALRAALEALGGGTQERSENDSRKDTQP